MNGAGAGSSGQLAVPPLLRRDPSRTTLLSSPRARNSVSESSADRMHERKSSVENQLLETSPVLAPFRDPPAHGIDSRASGVSLSGVKISNGAGYRGQPGGYGFGRGPSLTVASPWGPRDTWSREPSPSRTGKNRQGFGRSFMITPAADDDQSRASSGRLSSAGTPGDNDTLSMDEVVRELRQALAGHIVRQVDESESDIQRSLIELQKRLSDIKAIYAESVGVVSNLTNRRLVSKEELESRVKSLEDASEEFSMIEDLEKRIKSAQNRIEEYKQRMASVGELIDRQERENQVRKRRTFYTTWSTVLSFVVLIISLIIARNKYHARHGSAMVVEDSATIGLDDILRELDQLQSLPVVSVKL